MRSDQFAKKVKAHPTIMASKSDEVVAYQSSCNLAEKYPNQCDLHTFEHYKHNDFWQEEETLNVIQDYFREERLR